MPYYSSSNEEEIKIFFLLSLISQDVSYEYLIGLWFIYKKSKTLEVKTNKKKKKKNQESVCNIFSSAVFEGNVEVLSQPWRWWRRRAKTLTFSNISVITEGIYLKLRVVVHYQKGNS